MKDKIPYYELVNMFFVGTTFCLLMVFMNFSEVLAFLDEYAGLLVKLRNWSGLVGVVVAVAMFEIGFVLNRLGSVIIGTTLIWLGIWKQEKYTGNISKIERFDEKFKRMNIELVLIRTHIMMFVLLMIVAFYRSLPGMGIGFIVLILIFIWTGAKHNSRMNKIKERYKRSVKKRKNERKTI